jgi:membrane associated rhomboid family serine protease
MTWGLILANVLVFFYELSLGDAVQGFITVYGVVPAAISRGVPQTNLTPDPVYITLFTSMFMHGGWMHLIGNMLFLFIFGDNVEDRMGHIGYLIFYLLAGLVAGLTQVFVAPDSLVPSIGASGAIAGVLAAYLVLFPWSGVRTIVFIFIYFTIVTVPAVLLIGLWFLLQLFDGVAGLAHTQQGMGGVAYFAHIGGFVFGLLITMLLKNRLQPPAPITYPPFARHPNAQGPIRWY